MGVDSGILVSDLCLLDSDAFGVAHILGQAIRKLRMPDLVLTGCVSGDTGDKVVGPLLAEELGLPCITFVSRIEAANATNVKRWKEFLFQPGGFSCLRLRNYIPRRVCLSRRWCLV